MIVINLPCKPFVADFLRKKYGESISIRSKSQEIRHLLMLIQTSVACKRHDGFVEEYPDSVRIEFPRLFIFKNGKVGIPSMAIVQFNTFIRDQIVRGMNDFIDCVHQTVNSNEQELINNYLMSVGIEFDHINPDSWKKIRQRHKFPIAGKKTHTDFVPSKLILSHTHGKN